MKRLDEVQLFINRYYKALRLVLLGVIVVLVGLILISSLQASRRANDAKTEAIAKVVKSIKSENQHQTKIIKQQFQALCVLIVQTSGQQGLEQLEPSTQERCRELLSQQPANQASWTAPPAQASTPAPQHQDAAQDESAASERQPDDQQSDEPRPDTNKPDKFDLRRFISRLTGGLL